MKDDKGKRVASGLYHIKVTSGNSETRRVVLVMP
jgi:hypothetical protein